jgi:hypothetical protein
MSGICKYEWPNAEHEGELHICYMTRGHKGGIHRCDCGASVEFPMSKPATPPQAPSEPPYEGGSVPETPAVTADLERIAQLIAHRACCGAEHDPQNGKLHGHCVVCGVPWPCEYAGVPSATPPQVTGQEGLRLSEQQVLDALRLTRYNEGRGTIEDVTRHLNAALARTADGGERCT